MEFKKGDRVRLWRNTVRYAITEVGWEGNFASEYGSSDDNLLSMVDWDNYPEVEISVLTKDLELVKDPAKGKTAKELGYKVGDRFKVVNPGENWAERKGWIVTLIKDDDSPLPYFKRENDEREFVSGFEELEPIKEHDQIQCTEPVGKPVHVNVGYDISRKEFTADTISVNTTYYRVPTSENVSRAVAKARILKKGKLTIGGIMNKLSVTAQKLLDDKTKVLIKAGILDESLEVQDEDALISAFIVDKFKDELAAFAQSYLDEKESASKK